MENELKKRGIKELSPEDRPREKLIERGANALSVTELIAILINTGTTKASAVDLARQIMDKASGSLHNLCRMDVADLCDIDGIAEKKAVTLIAAFELANRKEQEPYESRMKITTSREAYNYFATRLGHLDYEMFMLMYLSRANEFIGAEPVSTGGRTGTVADPRVIFEKAIKRKAISIILAHNHPSGQKFPSQQDIDLTTKLVQAGTVLEIKVLDHLIITQNGYYSFADEGKIG